MIMRKKDNQLELMRVAGHIVSDGLDLMESLVRPGVTTQELNDACEALIRERGAFPIFLGYHGFPAAICASVNEEIVHGIPDGRRLKEGDIVSLDIGAKINGFIGDAAKTFAVGRVDEPNRLLIAHCREALEVAIRTMGPGVRLSEVSAAIEAYARPLGYGIVREYTGHGVGRELHEDPQVPNYYDPRTFGRDVVLRPGHVLAIEPMLNLGTHMTERVKRRGWDVVVTLDGKRSAHFEHTVAVLEDGVEVFTRREAPKPLPAALVV